MAIEQMITGMSAITTAIDITKAVVNAGGAIDKAELKLKMAEIASLLADAKQELIAKNEIIRELKTKIEMKEECIFRKPFIFRKTDTQFKEPFCQNCYESKDKMIHLYHTGDGSWQCKSCEAWFNEDQPGKLNRLRSSSISDDGGSWMSS